MSLSLNKFQITTENIDQFIGIAGIVISLTVAFLYYLALRSSIKNNKINTSASILNYYSNEIYKIREYGFEKHIVYDEQGEKEYYNVFNVYPKIKQVLSKLKKDQEYQNELSKNHPFENISLEDIKSKPYYANMVFMNDINNENKQIMRFLIRSLEILKEINGSKLLEEHKNVLRLSLYNNLLHTFLNDFEYNEDKGYHFVYKEHPDNAAVIDFQHISFNYIIYNFGRELTSTPKIKDRIINKFGYIEYLGFH